MVSHHDAATEVNPGCQIPHHWRHLLLSKLGPRETRKTREKREEKKRKEKPQCRSRMLFFLSLSLSQIIIIIIKKWIIFSTLFIRAFVMRLFKRRESSCNASTTFELNVKRKPIRHIGAHFDSCPVDVLEKRVSPFQQQTTCFINRKILWIDGVFVLFSFFAPAAFDVGARWSPTN